MTDNEMNPKIHRGLELLTEQDLTTEEAEEWYDEFSLNYTDEEIMDPLKPGVLSYDGKIQPEA